jgi:hypothetical protein
MWSLFASLAAAQEEKCVPLELSAFVEGLDRAEFAFEGGDSGEGTRLVDEFKAQMRCLTEIPTPAMVARLASLEALAGHFDQDPERSVRWARAAEWVVPGHLWPGAVSADHLLRGLVTEEGPAAIGEKGRHGFRVPENGAIVLSGRLVVDTDVAIDVPLFLQVCDGTGKVIRAEWQEGATFPEDLIGKEVPLVPTWWTREIPPGARRYEPAIDPVSTGSDDAAPRVAVFGAGGGGTVGQSLDQPGDFLANVQQAGGVGSVGALARVPLAGPLAAFADLRASIPGAVGVSEGFAGVALVAGPVQVQVGGGATTSPVFEAGERRRVAVGQPVLGLEATVPLGSLALDARAAGGGLPGAMHLRGGADLRSGGGVGWMVGLEGGYGRTGFVQPGTDRALAVAGAWGGLRAGVSFGG